MISFLQLKYIVKGSLNSTAAVMDISNLKMNGKRKRKINFTNQVVDPGDLSIRRMCGFVQLSREKYIKTYKDFKFTVNQVKLMSQLYDSGLTADEVIAGFKQIYDMEGKSKSNDIFTALI